MVGNKRISCPNLIFILSSCMQPTKKLDFDLIFVKRYFRSVLADQSNFLFSFSSFSKGLSFFVIFYHCFCYHCKMVLLFSFPRETKYKSCVSCTFLAWRGDWPSLLHKRDFIVHLSQKSSRIEKYLHQCK